VSGIRNGDPIQMLARFRDEQTTCPEYGRQTWQVHEWHRQVKREPTACGRQKAAKRQAYGYRDDRVFRLMILNLIHTH
jgi:transposase